LAMQNHCSLSRTVRQLVPDCPEDVRQWVADGNHTAEKLAERAELWERQKINRIMASVRH